MTFIHIVIKAFCLNGDKNSEKNENQFLFLWNLQRMKRDHMTVFNYVCHEGEIQEAMNEMPDGMSAVSGLAIEFVVLCKMKM